MAAASPLPNPTPELAVRHDRRVVLHGISWATYVSFRDSVDSPGVRMTYLRGTLEIMSPSLAHEQTKTQIARLLELFCLERDIPLYGFGSTTYRKEEEERGLEPDECYCRDRRARYPDIALEVDVSSGSLNKLDVYAGLGIREVWVYESGAFSVFALRGSLYEVIPSSVVFPEVDLAQIARFVPEDDHHAALKRFRAELRSAE